MRGVAVVALAVALVLLLEACRRRWQIATVVLPWLVTIDLTLPVHQVVLTTDTVMRTVGPPPRANTLVAVHVFQDAVGGHELRLPSWQWEWEWRQERTGPAIRRDPNARTTLWLSTRGGELIAMAT